MPDKPHRSRAGWRDMAAEPEEDDLVPGMPFHYHRPPKWIARSVVGLFVLASLNLAGLTLVYVHDYQQQQFIEGRGEARDRENDRLEQRINERLCRAYGQFPQDSPALDRAREESDCEPGNGIPLGLLSPEERGQIPAPADEPTVPLAPTPPLGAPASPDAPRPPINSPSPGNGLPPESSPAPDPLGPITNPLCDALGVCV